MGAFICIIKTYISFEFTSFLSEITYRMSFNGFNNPVRTRAIVESIEVIVEDYCKNILLYSFNINLFNCFEYFAPYP